MNADEGTTVLRRDEGKEKVYEGEVSAPTLDKPYTEVQDDYEANAIPGEGYITRDENYTEIGHEKEIKFAYWLHQNYGGDIHLIEEKGKPEGIPSPDYIWNGKLWDLKTVSTEKAANKALRKGYNQIEENPGGVMLNYGDHIIDNEKMLSVIEERMQWYRGETIDIMIVKNDRIYKVLRYKKR